MKNAIRINPGLLALLLLAGCYAQVEDSSITLNQTQICNTPPGCAGNNTPLTLTSNFIPKITVDLGDNGLLTSSESKQGGVTFETSFVLNKATVTMTTASNFSGVKTVDLRAALGADTCTAISANCKSIASYDSTRDGPATQTLVMIGSGVNLLDFQNAMHQVTIWARGTGNAPAAPTWNADLEVDVAIKSRGTF